ncbi:hypothetical protein NQ315_016394 [Exocentrus adspersus]|uniref:Uncharacterized protein n=1 Tax=Exocentrus adspersus TaxID=1586481 RepID=A0AAV8VPZ4_9CUCU|nr:hypothetical protein NQ315_016394 [Exocentrus adspersus]
MWLTSYVLILVTCAAIAYGRVIKDDPSTRIQEQGSTHRLGRYLNQNLGSVSPLLLQRRDVQTQVMRKLCSNCKAAPPCNIYKKCEPCTKWCLGEKNTTTSTETNEIPVVPTLSNRFGQKDMVSLPAPHEEILSAPTPSSETNKHVFTIGYFDSGHIKEIILRLLGMRDTSDIEHMVILSTTYSNLRPTVTELSRHVEDVVTKLNQEMERMVNEIMRHEDRTYLTKDEIEEVAENVLNRLMNPETTSRVGAANEEQSDETTEDKSQSGEHELVVDQDGATTTEAAGEDIMDVTQKEDQKPAMEPETGTLGTHQQSKFNKVNTHHHHHQNKQHHQNLVKFSDSYTGVAAGDETGAGKEEDDQTPQVSTPQDDSEMQVKVRPVQTITKKLVQQIKNRIEQRVQATKQSYLESRFGSKKEEDGTKLGQLKTVKETSPRLGEENLAGEEQDSKVDQKDEAKLGQWKVAKETVATSSRLGKTNLKEAETKDGEQVEMVNKEDETKQGQWKTVKDHLGEENLEGEEEVGQQVEVVDQKDEEKLGQWKLAKETVPTSARIDEANLEEEEPLEDTKDGEKLAQSGPEEEPQTITVVSESKSRPMAHSQLKSQSPEDVDATVIKMEESSDGLDTTMTKIEETPDAVVTTVTKIEEVPEAVEATSTDVEKTPEAVEVTDTEVDETPDAVAGTQMEADQDAQKEDEALGSSDKQSEAKEEKAGDEGVAATDEGVGMEQKKFEADAPNKDLQENVSGLLQNLKKDAQLTSRIVSDFDTAKAVLKDVENIVEEIRKETSTKTQEDTATVGAAQKDTKSSSQTLKSTNHEDMSTLRAAQEDADARSSVATLEAINQDGRATQENSKTQKGQSLETVKDDMLSTPGLYLRPYNPSYDPKLMPELKSISGRVQKMEEELRTALKDKSGSRAKVMDTETVGSQPMEAVPWDKNLDPKTLRYMEQKNKATTRLGSSMTELKSSAIARDEEETVMSEFPDARLLKPIAPDEGTSIKKTAEEQQEETDEVLGKNQPINTRSGTTSSDSLDKQEWSTALGSLLPWKHSKTLSSLHPNKDLYFTGNGIKLPLQMVRNHNGAVELSVDLDRLCSCKNSTICNKNHIEEAVGNILEKAAITESNVIQEEQGLLNMKNAIASSLDPNEEQAQQADVTVFKRSVDQPTGPVKFVIPLDSEQAEEPPNTFQQFLKKKLSELESKIVDVERRVQQESPVNSIDKDVEATITERSNFLSNYNKPNNKMKTMDKLLRSPETIELTSRLKDILDGAKKPTSYKFKKTSDSLNKMKNLNLYGNQDPKQQGELSKREAVGVSEGGSSSFIKKEVDIMNNILQFLKTLSDKKK